MNTLFKQLFTLHLFVAVIVSSTPTTMLATQKKNGAERAYNSFGQKKQPQDDTQAAHTSALDDLISTEIQNLPVTTTTPAEQHKKSVQFRKDFYTKALKCLPAQHPLRNPLISALKKINEESNRQKDVSTLFDIFETPAALNPAKRIHTTWVSPEHLEQQVFATVRRFHGSHQLALHVNNYLQDRASAQNLSHHKKLGSVIKQAIQQIASEHPYLVKSRKTEALEYQRAHKK